MNGKRPAQIQLKVPDYNDLLKFLDIRAQAFESLTHKQHDKAQNFTKGKHQLVNNLHRSNSHNVVSDTPRDHCCVCKQDKDHLYGST